MSVTDQETMQRISGNLRRLRGDLSLAEVARRAGTYPTTIKQVEDGERMPGVGLLTRIAEAIGASVDDMLAPLSEKIAG